MNRRWFPRFGIRTILVVTTAIAVWLAWHLQSARDQKQAVAKIRDCGGFVRYSTGWDVERNKPKTWVPRQIFSKLGIDFFHSVYAVDLTRPRRLDSSNDPKIVSELRHFRYLKSLKLPVSHANDSSMGFIARLRYLEHLEITSSRARGEYSRITDVGVAKLARLHRLRELRLMTGDLTDRSLAVVGGLTQLEILSLGDPRPLMPADSFGDIGISYLENLRELRALSLKTRYATDESLRFLAGLSQLGTLSLKGHSLTDKGMSYLAARSNLSFLNLHADNPSLTDKCIESIQQLPKLSTLVVLNCAITDAGLKQLESTQTLKTVSIGSIHATQSGADRLSKVLVGEVYVGECSVRNTFRGILSQELKREVNMIELDKAIAEICSDAALSAKAIDGIETWVRGSTVVDVRAFFQRVRSGDMTIAELAEEMERISTVPISVRRMTGETGN